MTISMKADCCQAQRHLSTPANSQPVPVPALGPESIVLTSSSSLYGITEGQIELEDQEYGLELSV